MSTFKANKVANYIYRYLYIFYIPTLDFAAFDLARFNAVFLGLASFLKRFSCLFMSGARRGSAAANLAGNSRRGETS